MIDSFTSRRAVLAGVVGLPAMALAAPGAAGETVIDTATHFYDPSRPQGVPWPSAKEPVLFKSTLPERYLAAVEPYSVSAVVAIEASPWLEDNLWLLEVGERYPLIRAVVGNIPPGHTDYRAALERFSRHPLWRGIRVNASALTNLNDLKLLSEKNLSLDVLIGQPVYAAIAALAKALPELRIVVGHLPLDDSLGMDVLARCPNVYAKVSGVVRRVEGAVPTNIDYYRAGLDNLWKVFGPERLLFASNWPTCDLIAPYPVVYKLMADYLVDRPADVRRLFFRNNAERVYRLV